MDEFYVYMLRCSDGSYYTGVTRDYHGRVNDHHNGRFISCYTHKRRPVELVYLEIHNSIREAIGREKQIKGWTRKKKEALARRDYEALVLLSKGRGSTGSP